MAAIKDGGPAFPNAPHSAPAVYGMTLRDYFAAQALTQLVRYYMDRDDTDIDEDQRAAARAAYGFADAMLKAREGK
jgi:hypothetical protein